MASSYLTIGALEIGLRALESAPKNYVEPPAAMGPQKSGGPQATLREPSDLAGTFGLRWMDDLLRVAFFLRGAADFAAAGFST